jgi:hypothetical protein
MELVRAEEFDGAHLDEATWLPSYLPAWSSRSDAAATFEVRDSCLRLWIPAKQGPWCAGDHKPETRISGIQTGNFSGPVGSTTGQQPYRDGLVVREAQPEFHGWLFDEGYLEIRMRGVVDPSSMIAFWLVGFEDAPERCAEVCVMEAFGNAVEPGSAAVGMGLHAFRDPLVAEDFAAPRLPLALDEFHDYGVRRTADRVEFFVDGESVRSCDGPPAYPLQFELAVFDCADWGERDPSFVPELVVDHVREFR